MPDGATASPFAGTTFPSRHRHFPGAGDACKVTYVIGRRIPASDVGVGRACRPWYIEQAQVVQHLHNEEACDETAIGSGRDSLCRRCVAGCECRCSGANREECGSEESVGPKRRDRHAQYDERCVSPRCAQTGRRRQGLRSRRGNVHWHADLLCAVRRSQLSDLHDPYPDPGHR